MKSMKQDSPNHNSLCLRVIRKGDLFDVRIHKPDAAMRLRDKILVSVTEIEDQCREMIEYLNKASRKGGHGRYDIKTIERMGRMLADKLLPLKIKEELAKTDAEYLELDLEDEVVHIPWELLNVGNGFLCQRFNMGRMTDTSQKFVSHDRKISNPLQMWILANPRNDLNSANTECDNICSIIDQMNENDALINLHTDSDINRNYINKVLKDFDIVHFAGHADFNVQDPSQSCWKLKDSDFKAEDVHNMMGGADMPSLVFSNACQSARTQEWTGASPFGLANAFMRAGVKHYIGTSWDIMDEPGSRFAQSFYKYLLSGMTAGEAVRQARKAMIEKGDEICWTSYVLYGNPKERYFEPVNAEISDKAEPVLPIFHPISDNNKPTRGKEPSTESSVNSRKILTAIISGIVLLTVISSTIIAFSTIRKTDTKDDWTSGFKSIAVIHENQQSSNAADLVAKDIESCLTDDCPNIIKRFTVVNRNSAEFELIMKEYEIGHIDPAYKLTDGIINMYLLLYVRVIKENSDLPNIISIRLTDVQKAKVIFQDQSEYPVSRQARKAWARDHVVRKMIERYPLRGEITEVSDNGIELNIGDNVGVDMKQKFRVLGKEDTILEIVSMKADSNSSLAKVIKGNSDLSKNLKVIFNE